MTDPELWRELGQQLRVDSIRAAAVPKSGHPTSSMSAADLMAVLLAKHLRYDFDNPDDPRNDHLIFSKGHASPLVYSLFKAAGAITDEELLTFRKFGSRLEGHPTPKMPWGDVATGSLGQGLPISVGVALAGKKLDRLPYNVWCLCGDSEIAEGSMWEAFEHAAFKALDDPESAIEELGGERNIVVKVHKPEGDAQPHTFETGALELPAYDLGSEVATRKAYGDALLALGKGRGDVVALDGEVSNSTYAEEFAKELPERYFEMYIAEQQMVAAAVGLQVRNWKPFASSFAAFFSRAYDFVRMAAISQANIRLSGSHAGVSIGEDGPSQMALEDIASLRAVHGSTVLYPSDANQTAKLVAAMADLDGISFIRTTRGATPVVYAPDDEFPVGGARVARDGDDVTLVGAGITLHEALKAADALADEGLSARVIDLYALKPVDVDTLREAVEATGRRVVVAEDHWPEGGLGETVLSALVGEELAFEHLAVREMPGSGKPAELLAAAGIDADAIAAAARKLVSAEAVAR